MRTDQDKIEIIEVKTSDNKTIRIDYNTENQCIEKVYATSEIVINGKQLGDLTEVNDINKYNRVIELEYFGYPTD